jgi:uncharacterized protein YecT (DUF1311 family)
MNLMRSWLVVLGLIAIASMSAAQAEDCGNAPDQSAMNRCADKSFQQADAELNTLYRQITNRLKGDGDAAATLKAFIAAQRAWIAFRDAECAFVGSKTIGGSVQPMIVASCRAGLTEKRIADFKTYLKCEEGDLICPVPAP